MVQRRRIDGGVHIAGREQSRQRGGKSKTARAFANIERFDAEAVARKNDAPAVPFPDRKREHSVEALNTTRTPLSIRFENDFGVALRKEPIAFCRELLP